MADGKTGEEMIREMFRNASLFNLNTVRVYAHTTDPDHRVQVPSQTFLSYVSAWRLVINFFMKSRVSRN